MTDGKKIKTSFANENTDVAQNSLLDENAIEKQHQYQMFPTPDEKQASEEINRLDD